MISVVLTMIGSLSGEQSILEFVLKRAARFSHLKNIDTQMKAKAAESEMYCGSAQRRWLS